MIQPPHQKRNSIERGTKAFLLFRKQGNSSEENRKIHNREQAVKKN